MTWKCRWCGHTTIWWRGACDLCGIPLPGERVRMGVGERVRMGVTVKTVPVLDTGIGRALGYADDKAFMRAADEEREKAMALLSVDERARLEAAERELERRVIHGDGT